MFLPPVGYYRLIARARSVVIDGSQRFDKRFKAAHRCTIADVRGPANLTVPIEKPTSMTAARWSDILISDHNHWWTQALETLKSAYGRTPFFEFYLDAFEPFFAPSVAGRPLVDYNQALDHLCRRLIGLQTPVAYNSDPSLSAYNSDPETCAATSVAAPKSVVRDFEIPDQQPYYQVRALDQGFHPGLSIVDLLFNLGPESLLYLR